MSNLLKKLTNLLTRRRQAGTDPALGVLTDLDKKIGAKILKRQALERKVINTHQGGPNMPKYQPCPRCRRMSKRMEKTEGGAKYKCREHGKFFMRALGL